MARRLLVVFILFCGFTVSVNLHAALMQLVVAAGIVVLDNGDTSAFFAELEQEMQMALTKDAILKAEDVTTEEVQVPEWGGSVLIKGLTGRQRDEFEASILERRGRQMVTNTANIRAKLAARCMVDEKGERLFTDAEAAELGEKSAAPIDRVYEAAARLSGLSEQDVEDLAEDFGEAPGSSSSSG